MRLTPRRATLIAVALLLSSFARADDPINSPTQVQTGGPPPDAQPIDPYADPPQNGTTPGISPPGLTQPRTPPPNPSGNLTPQDPYADPPPAQTPRPQPAPTNTNRTTAPPPATGPITSPSDPRLGQPAPGRAPTGLITSPRDPRLNAAVGAGAAAGAKTDAAVRKAKALGEQLKQGTDRDAGAMPEGGGAGGYIEASAIAPGVMSGAVKDRQAVLDKLAVEPKATQKRPDFFSIFPRDKFDQLIKEFQLKPGDKAFKDVGLSEDKRDFIRTASCNKGLDKGCNPADAASYKIGDFVSPEDLNAIYDALRPQQFGSYYDYFQAQDKAKKLPAGDEAYRFRSKKFESKDFDHAIAICLPDKLGGSFDGAAHTLDDIDNYARQAVFKCGVQVAEQTLEYNDLVKKKEKLGALFKDQAKLDALSKTLGEREKRLPQDDAAERLLAPGGKPIKGAKPAVPDDLRRGLTQAALAGLAEVPGLSDEMRGQARRWFYNEVGEDVANKRAAVAGAVLDALAEKEPALKGLSADLVKKNADQKTVEKVDAALDAVLKKNPDALPKDDPRLKAYEDANAAAARFYQQWLLSGTAEYGTSASARELGADFLAKWVAPLGLDAAKIRRVAVEAVPSLVTGKPVGGWRFYNSDGSSMFVSYGGALTQAKGARGNSMTTQRDEGKIRKLIELPAKKTVQKGVWDSRDVPVDVWETREAGAPAVIDGKKVVLDKGSTHILAGKVVFYDQTWTQANGRKHREYYNNEKYSSETFGRKARAHVIEEYQANGDRLVSRSPLSSDGSEGPAKLYLITAAGQAVAALTPFSENLKDFDGGLGTATYGSEDQMLDGAVPKQLIVNLSQLGAVDESERDELAGYMADQVVKTMKWGKEKAGPLKTAFLFRAADDTRRALDARALKQVGHGGQFFVDGDKIGFRSECGGHCGRLYEDFDEIAEAGQSLPDLSGRSGQEVEPAEFRNGTIDKGLSLVTYRPMVFEDGRAAAHQPPDAGNVKTAEYSAGHTTEWLVKVDKSDASTFHSGKLKFTYYVKVHDGGSAYWKNGGRYGDPVEITTEPSILSQSFSQIGNLPVLKQFGQVTGHVAGWAYHDVIQSNVQGGIGAISGNDTYKLCSIATSVRGHGYSHEGALKEIEADHDLDQKFTQAAVDSCMEGLKNTRIRPELMRADAYAAQGPEHCRQQAQSHADRLKYLDVYCSAAQVANEGGTVGAVLGGLDMAGEVGANIVVTVPGIGGATSLLGKAEAFGKALAVGELATGDAIAFGRATQAISAASELYLHGGMMTQFATGALDSAVNLADASTRADKISGVVNIVGDIAGMKLGAKRGLDQGEVPAPEATGETAPAPAEAKTAVAPPPDVGALPEPPRASEEVTSVGKKPSAPFKPESPPVLETPKTSLLAKVGDKLKSFFGGDKGEAPAVETKAPETGPKAELLSKKEILNRFNGVDPLDETRAPRAPGNDIRGQGGWKARKIIINGEEWVIKNKRAANAAELADNKETAQNVALSAELVRLGSDGIFDVPETLAYTDGDTVVTLMRFEKGAHKSAAGHKLMSAQERAELSILSLVFGFEDRNYGNQLIPNERIGLTKNEPSSERPVLIDFDAMNRDPRGQMDPTMAKNVYYKHGYAPWVDGGQYNDPKVYQEAEARWKKKLEDPEFQKKLRGALERSGFDKKAADAYFETVAKNLGDYEHNVGVFLDIANQGHEPPPAVIEMTAGEPTNAASPKAKIDAEDSRGESTNAASPKAKAVVPLAERKAFTADALVKYHELVISIDSGDAEGRGKVTLYGRAENLGPKGQKIVSEFKKKGFEVEFSVKGERELPSAPRPDEIYRPEQNPAKVHYPRRVDSFEKNAVINDDERTFEATSGTMQDAHGSIILREPYKGTKEQKTLVARFNKLGYEVSFSGNESNEGAKVVSGADGREYWNYKSGELFKDSAVIKDAEQRGALMATPASTLETSPDPKVRALAAAAERVQDAIAQAEAKKKIAAESWEGQQSCSEGNCVSRAAVNVRPQGDAHLHDVFAAAEKHGIDPNNGMHSEQTRSVLGELNAQRAASGQPGRYVSVPLREFEAAQNAAIARGEAPPAGLIVIRRGDGTTHAVVDRGGLTVDGEHYRILTDSTKSAPVPYDAKAYAEAAISDYVIVFDEKSKAAVPADPALETTKVDKPHDAPVRSGPDLKSRIATLGQKEFWHGWQDRLGHLFQDVRRFIDPTDTKALERRQAEEQKQRLDDFKKTFIIKASQMDKLPGGIPERYKPAFEAIRELTGDKTRFFEHMQALEREIAARAREKNVSIDDAREQILGEWEARHGFKPVIDLHPTPTENTLSDKKFLALLRDGALFRDKFFNDKEQVPGSHGEETHRLQWNAVMREMEAHPEKFGDVKQASELYKELGNLDRASLDWRGTSVENDPSDLWFRLFDSPPGDSNWASPEYTRNRKDYWPGLGKWE